VFCGREAGVLFLGFAYEAGLRELPKNRVVLAVFHLAFGWLAFLNS